MRHPSPERALILIGFLGGLGYALLTPPFQVPDEGAHFARAYAISEGHVISKTVGNETGEIIPLSIVRLVPTAMGSIHFHPAEKFSAARFAEAWAIELKPSERVFHGYTTTASYGPVVYLPQALMMSVLSLFGTRPLIMLYAARLAALTAALFLLCCALRLTPTHRWLLVVLALMPMTLFELSSVSADAMTIALSFLAVAVMWRLMLSDEQQTPAVKWLIPILGLALALGKPIYPALLALLAFSSARHFATPQKRVVYVGLVWMSSLATALAWMALQPARTPLRHDGAVDPEGHFSYLLHHPIDLLSRMGLQILDHAPGHAEAFIGVLGWLDTHLPTALVFGYWGLLVFVAVTKLDAATQKFTPAQRLGMVALFWGVFALISIASYIFWIPANSPVLDDIQGRYLIPIAAPALAALPQWLPRESNAARIGIGITVALALATGVSLLTLVFRYYLPGAG
jgi:uncharacterized membrane protein